MPDDDLDLDDYSDEDETEDPEPQGQNPVRARLRKLEKENREYRKAQAQAEADRRQVAFLKAGINPDDPKQSYFVKGYDGDLNPDTIRVAAVEAGFAEPPPEPPDAAAHAAIATASSGGITPPPDTGEPRFVQDPVGYAEARKAARTQEELMDIMGNWGSPVGSRILGE